MADSPIHADVHAPSTTIYIDGTEVQGSIELISVSVKKEVNKVPYALVKFRDGSVEDETFENSESGDFIPGKDLKITMGYDSTEGTVFEGVITSHSIRVRRIGGATKSELTVKAHDKCLKMTVGRKSEYFKDKKDSDIITSLISKSGAAKTVEATTAQHKMMVHYDSTDWDFLLTRAEANGQLIVVEDAKVQVGKPEVSGSAVLALNFGKDVMEFQGDMDARPQLTAVESYGWDPSTLKVVKGASAEPSALGQGNITGKKLSEVAAPSTFEMRSPVPETAAVLKEWSNAKLQLSRLAKIRGTVTFPGSDKVKIGKLIELSGFGARFNGDAFISGLVHTFSEGNWTTTVTFGLSEKFFTETANVSTPVASGLLPGIQGLTIGKVKKIDADPDGEHRVQVDLPMVKESGDGVWARLTNPYASNKVGMFFYPEVGDEVIIGFLNDDPRFAIILGAVYGKKMAPPYTPDNKNMNKGFLTKSKLSFHFDDDKKVITIETPGKNKIIVSDDGKSIKLEDQNKNKISMESGGITLDSPKDINIKSKGAITLDAAKAVNIKAKGGDVKIEGLNVKAKASIAFAAEGAAKAELKASGQAIVKGAMVMIN
jgi:Rhs element Vgr protein